MKRSNRKFDDKSEASLFSIECVHFHLSFIESKLIDDSHVVIQTGMFAESAVVVERTVVVVLDGEAVVRVVTSVVLCASVVLVTSIVVVEVVCHVSPLKK